MEIFECKTLDFLHSSDLYAPFFAFPHHYIAKVSIYVKKNTKFRHFIQNIKLSGELLVNIKGLC